jgi:hypothetical protein
MVQWHVPGAGGRRGITSPDDPDAVRRRDELSSCLVPTQEQLQQLGPVEHGVRTDPAIAASHPEPWLLALHDRPSLMA